MNKPLCIIPARGGSKRFPRKNTALFQGKPLVGIATEKAKESRVFALVCVSSDDDDIMRMGKEYGADVLHRRPENLARDGIQLSDVCKNVLEYFASEGKHFDAFAVLTPMNPLRALEDIARAAALLQETGADTVLSLARHTHSPQRALAVRNNRIEQYFPDEELEKYETEEQLYYHDAAILFARTKPFIEKSSFFGSNVAPYFTPPERSVNIDYPIDLAWAEFLLSRHS